MSITTTITFHPLANIFPLIEGAQFEELVADAKVHGIREPIWLYEDQIIDGRNRYRASEAAGVDCPWRIYKGTDPLAFVISLNLKRRHLDESQRAIVAAKIANLEHGGDRSKSPIGDLSVSQADAAKMLNVGKRSVERAKHVINAGADELVSAVERGDVSVSTAADIARHATKEEQRQIIAACDPKEIVAAAKTIKMAKLKNTTGEYEWYTPSQYVEAARSVLGVIDLDPASSDVAQRTVKAARYLTIDDDGLTHEWHGRIWLNPPYARGLINDFVEKLISEYEAGHLTSAIMVVHSTTDTSWFQAVAHVASAICFTDGRIAFEKPDGAAGISGTLGSAFFYFGPNPSRFAEVFGAFGFVTPAPYVHASNRLLEAA